MNPSPPGPEKSGPPPKEQPAGTHKVLRKDGIGSTRTKHVGSLFAALECEISGGKRAFIAAHDKEIDERAGFAEPGEAFELERPDLSGRITVAEFLEHLERASVRKGDLSELVLNIVRVLVLIEHPLAAGVTWTSLARHFGGTKAGFSKSGRRLADRLGIDSTRVMSSEACASMRAAQVRSHARRKSAPSDSPDLAAAVARAEALPAGSPEQIAAAREARRLRNLAEAAREGGAAA